MAEPCSAPLLLAAAGFRFASPWWLVAAAALPLAVWFRGRGRLPVLLVPFAAAWFRPSALGSSRWPALLAGAGVALLPLALARPQVTQSHREVRHEGYDIMLCIDLSSSMLSEDYVRNGRRINRLEAIRPVIKAFVERRPDDRIGVVLFAAKAYTLAPLTLDHEWLARQLDRVQIGLIEDSTAIGDGLGVALTRLEQPDRESGGRRRGAFIVLLTDGSNNAGALLPLQAAAIAHARGIPIYPIGAGQAGMMSSDLDEGALRELATETGGHFFRAADTDTIELAFHDIDASQKIEFQARTYLTTTELFAWPAGFGSALLAWGALAVLL